jgi:hypothetical protein
MVFKGKEIPKEISSPELNFIKNQRLWFWLKNSTGDDVNVIRAILE